MLTIFGPIQWAFSILPKWEGAWAKWLTRYLTVHFYGAMLYFVGFYVLLLFDIVLCIQIENLTAITASEQTMAAYLQNSFFSAGYLMAASIVASSAEPCSGLGGMDDTGGRHGILYPKLRRGRGTAGEDDGNRRVGRHHEIIRKR